MSALTKNTLMRVVILALVLFFITVFVSLRIRQNELDSMEAQLQDRVDVLQGQIDELSAELEEPFDEEYIARIAREKLGLRYPDEIVFYSGNKASN